MIPQYVQEAAVRHLEQMAAVDAEWMRGKKPSHVPAVARVCAVLDVVEKHLEHYCDAIEDGRVVPLYRFVGCREETT